VECQDDVKLHSVSPLSSRLFSCWPHSQPHKIVLGLGIIFGLVLSVLGLVLILTVFWPYCNLCSLHRYCKIVVVRHTLTVTFSLLHCHCYFHTIIVTGHCHSISVTLSCSRSVSAVTRTLRNKKSKAMRTQNLHACCHIVMMGLLLLNVFVFEQNHSDL